MAIKKNNYLVSSHFHKWWQRYIKTWFHQPSQKLARRYQRNQKLVAEAPRPVGHLRPVVHCTSPRYNMKVRGGRGFSLEELKKAGISKKVAPTIGIAVDARRRNRSDESLNSNTERLKTYKQRLVVFPRRSKLRKGFGGLPDDTARNEASKMKAMPIAKYMPIEMPKVEMEARAITQADRDFDAFRELKKARFQSKKGQKRTEHAARKKKLYESREARRQHKAMG